MKIMRNDLCWCGSGKKYKKCHESIDQKLKTMELKGYKVPPRNLIKNDQQIQNIKKSALITREILDILETKVTEGITTKEIDNIVYKYAISKGAVPGTIGYNGYKHSSCISINDVICHGIPDETILKSGDIVNVDITINLDGYFSDASRMYCVGKVSDKAKALVHCTKECLERAIKTIKPYEPLNVIGEIIEPYANANGFSVVRDYIGHGVGLALHESPEIYHFISNEKSILMAPGMVFTIEPMINEKSYETKTLSDGWTVTTVDGGLSAQWEHTILVTSDGVEILT